MKTFKSSLFILMLFTYSFTGICNDVNNHQIAQTEEETLQILCTPEFMDLASTWVSGFEQLHPGEKILVDQITDGTSFSEGKLFLLPANHQQIIQNEGAWKVIIGHDVIVPIVNSGNPLINAINKQGLMAEDFKKIMSENSDWSSVLENAPKTPLQCYISDNPQVLAKIINFTQTDKISIKPIELASAEDVVLAVRENVNAIGFCRLSDVVNKENNTFTEQINILPVDKNGNGRIDGFENIYNNPAEFTRGVWIGKYPGELSNEIIALSASKPTNTSMQNFLTWTIEDGQNLLNTLGFSHLKSREKIAGMLALRNTLPPSNAGNDTPRISSGLIISLGIFIFILMAVFFIYLKSKKKAGIHSEDIAVTPSLNENSILAPKGLLYDKSHTWAFLEKDGLIKIGIDDFIQHITGTITQVKMKLPGEKVKKGEKIFSVIHEGKQLNLSSPVTGIIKNQNQSLMEDPSLINSGPYADGWVYQIEPGNWIRETRFMFMAEKYKEWLEDEFIRLKDFLAASANTNQVVYNHIILQDGGELTDNVLSEMGPEVWEDFQTHFMDVSK